MTIRTFVSLVALVCIARPCMSADAQSGEDMVVSRHDDIVKSVALSQDGKFVASAGFDGKVMIRRTDAPATSPMIVDLGDSLLTVVFSKNGRHVYAAGNCRGYKIARIRMGTDETETIGPDVSGTIDLVHENPDNTLTIVTAENRIIRYSPEHSKTTAAADIFGGFLGCISATADGAYVAVSSQNIRGNRSAEPCRMTVFDKDCVRVFSYQYESSAVYDGSQHAFGLDRTLYLVTSQHLVKFVFDPDKVEWQTSRSQLPPKRLPRVIETLIQRIWKPSAGLSGKFGRPASIAVAGNPARIWVADHKRVLEIDPDTSEIIEVRHFQIGPQKGEFFTDPINSIAVNLEAGILAVACQDGTARLSYLHKQKNQPNTAAGPQN